MPDWQTGETMAWAVLRDEPDRELIVAISQSRDTAQHMRGHGDRVVRVSVRIVEAPQ